MCTDLVCWPFRLIVMFVTFIVLWITSPAQASTNLLIPVHFQSVDLFNRRFTIHWCVLFAYNPQQHSIGGIVASDPLIVASSRFPWLCKDAWQHEVSMEVPWQQRWSVLILAMARSLKVVVMTCSYHMTLMWALSWIFDGYAARRFLLFVAFGAKKDYGLICKSKIAIANENFIFITLYIMW